MRTFEHELRSLGHARVMVVLRMEHTLTTASTEHPEAEDSARISTTRCRTLDSAVFRLQELTLAIDL